MKKIIEISWSLQGSGSCGRKDMKKMCVCEPPDFPSYPRYRIYSQVRSMPPGPFHQFITLLHEFNPNIKTEEREKAVKEFFSSLGQRYQVNFIYIQAFLTYGSNPYCGRCATYPRMAEESQLCRKCFSNIPLDPSLICQFEIFMDKIYPVLFPEIILACQFCIQGISGNGEQLIYKMEIPQGLFLELGDRKVSAAFCKFPEQNWKPVYFHTSKLRYFNNHESLWGRLLLKEAKHICDVQEYEMLQDLVKRCKYFWQLKLALNMPSTLFSSGLLYQKYAYSDVDFDGKGFVSTQRYIPLIILPIEQVISAEDQVCAFLEDVIKDWIN